LEPPFIPEKQTGLAAFFAEERRYLFLEKMEIRHFIYDHPDCVPTIVEWLEEADLLGGKEGPSKKAGRKARRDQERDVTDMRFDA
jgi:hypothetical protein